MYYTTSPSVSFLVYDRLASARRSVGPERCGTGDAGYAATRSGATWVQNAMHDILIRRGGGAHCFAEPMLGRGDGSDRNGRTFRITNRGVRSRWSSVWFRQAYTVMTWELL